MVGRIGTYIVVNLPLKAALVVLIVSENIAKFEETTLAWKNVSISMDGLIVSIYYQSMPYLYKVGRVVFVLL